MAGGSWGLYRVGAAAALLALVAGVPAVLVEGQVRTPWILASATAAAVVAGTLGAVWRDRYLRQVQQRDEQAMQIREGCLMLNGQLPKVSQVRNPLYVGVHPAPGASRTLSEDHSLPSPRVPVYVPRDIDGQLRELLACGGFVLIVGDSTAGKTRSAYEAMAATLPEHILIVPHGRDALPSALARAAEIRHCVVWLDDLEQFLGALTRNTIAELVEEHGCHRVILATLRAAEETRYTSDSIADQSGRQAHRDAREVLEQAERLQLPRLFTSAERQRARLRDWDHRIVDALTHAETYGIAEYLAAGPELLRDWEDAWNPNTDPSVPANPRGAALVMAAVDIRRAGYTAPLPVKLLADVHSHYLEERGGRRLHPEPYATAWAWARQPRRATTALLQAMDDHHVEVFDYLVDVVQRRSQPEDHVADPVVRAAIDAGDPADADSIAATAYTHGRYDLAHYAYRAAYQAKLQNPGVGEEDPSTLRTRAA
jgi:eukaryotic-like serine/threonine-protein kinase